MSSFLQELHSNYKEINIGTDPDVDKWLFMQSPVPVVTILSLYLYFVLKLGPQWMSTRKPFQMKPLLIAYNGYQVLFSIWLCSHIFEVDFRHLLKHGCHPASRKGPFFDALAKSAWWYFFSKLVELLDTVFFVLRKKQNQVTFLHVYHHTITALFSWGYLKYVPGEQGIVIGFLNSFVHIVMYFYYMVAAMGPEYQKYLWWKKYMTWIQLTQFCMMLAYLVFIVAMDCNLPRSLTFFFVGNVIIFLYLFSDFYRKTYKKNEDASAKKLAHSNGTKAVKCE
ncbi:elongation of very long chain fatty acids protein AAEL008004-like [Ctenocephalides felis]|uniref:elongation of very long chain fatty acids protein AAEL008004-like n=1 Tax=Ctenocephalides felis TaxID=7515 RepID=UPI000E6E2A55|nr:elongation of very long chain fatty acids protein AAEL008004-like [Ctenocephalides felis]